MVLAIYRDVYAVCSAASPKASLVTHDACWRQMEIEQDGGRGVRDEESQGKERWEKDSDIMQWEVQQHDWGLHCLVGVSR